MDPANRNVILVLAYTYQNLEEEEKAESLLAEHSELPFEIGSVRMNIGAEGTELSGMLTNLNLTPGTVVRLQFEILTLGGAAIATPDIEVAAPLVGQTARFVMNRPTPGDIAGWRYEILDPR